MKKTPILLASLISGSMGIAVPISMTYATQQGGDTKILSNDPLSGENLDIAVADNGRDKIYLNDAQDPNFRLLSVNYKQNEVGIDISADEGWFIKRVVIAHRNYEAGVTEAEAEGRLSSLGVDNNELWEILYDCDAKGLSNLYHYHQVGASLRGNLTDVIYYAVEYGHKTKAESGEIAWSDEWWSRGEVNYRRCGHATIFDPEEMICMREGDGSYGIRMANTFTKVEMPAEEVVSWDEEWNAIQLQRYTDVVKRLTDLRTTLYETPQILDQLEKILAGLEITMPKSENMPDKGDTESEIVRMKDSIKTLRKYYTGMSSTNQEEIVLLKQKIEEILREKDTLTKDKEELAAENESLRQKIEVLTRENLDDNKAENVTTTEKKEGAAEQKELVPTTETKIVVVPREKDEVAGNDVVSGEGEEKIDSEDTQNTAEEAVAVPNLGDLDTNSKLTPRWLIILGIGVLGSTILMIGHIVRRKYK